MKRRMMINLESIDEQALAELLRKFYAEVRTNDNKLYSPGTLRGLRAGLHRAITGNPYNRTFNILTDSTFILANRTFETMCKKWVGTGKQSHHPAIEKGDLIKLLNYFQNYKCDPVTLTNTFWFLLCYFFARRGREGFRTLTKDSFTIKEDDKGIKYLAESHSEISKNWQGGTSSKAWDYSDQRGYGIQIGESNINLVDVYTFYTSKLSPDNEALFQKPLKNWEKSEYWFGKTVLGKNKLGQIMKSISEKCGMSRVYTNHSVRATAITIMYQNGIDTKQICKITKHKTEESLKHYISGQTSDQKRRCAEVLCAGISTGSEMVRVEQNKNVSETECNYSSYNSSSNVCFPVMGNQTLNFNASGGSCNFYFTYKNQV